MRDIISGIEPWLQSGQPFVLATVVKTWGSAPRPCGSHMAISESGQMMGSVSGGCVESAVLEASREVLKQNLPQNLKFGVSDETAWEVGLACGGTIEVFVQKIGAKDKIFASIQEILNQHATGILATLIRGNSEWTGRQLLLKADGHIGKIDGGNIDSAVIQQYDVLHPPRKAEVLSLPGQEIFVEPILPLPRLFIIGGVHIAIPLTKFARELGYEIYLIDPRKNFANPQRFPHLEHILNLWPDEAIEKLGLDANTFVVVLAHDPKLDDPALLAALRGQPIYIGVLGSRRTHARRVRRLLESGISENEIRRLHAPVGLSIGAKTPAEIALSIVAEMTAVQRGANV